MGDGENRPQVPGAAAKDRRELILGGIRKF